MNNKVTNYEQPPPPYAYINQSQVPFTNWPENSEIYFPPTQHFNANYHHAQYTVTPSSDISILESYNELKLLPQPTTAFHNKALMKIVDKQNQIAFSCEVEKVARPVGNTGRYNHQQKMEYYYVYRMLDTHGNVIVHSKLEGNVMSVETGSNRTLGIIRKDFAKSTFHVEPTGVLEQYIVHSNDGRFCPTAASLFYISNERRDIIGEIQRIKSDHRFGVTLSQGNITLELKALLFMTTFMIYDSYFSEVDCCGITCSGGRIFSTVMGGCCCFVFVMIIVAVVVVFVMKSEKSMAKFSKHIQNNP